MISFPVSLQLKTQQKIIELQLQFRMMIVTENIKKLSLWLFSLWVLLARHITKNQARTYNPTHFFKNILLVRKLITTK